MTQTVTETVEDFFAADIMMAGDRPFEKRRTSLLDSAKRYLEYHRELCRKQHEEGASGTEVVASVTAMIDELVHNLHVCVTAEYPFERQSCVALIALGGYGRKELNPLSDVDLMFYCGERNKDLAEQIADLPPLADIEKRPLPALGPEP